MNTLFKTVEHTSVPIHIIACLFQKAAFYLEFILLQQAMDALISASRS